jgi:hypothetical protein
MTGRPNADSPRMSVVLLRREELLLIADRLGARGLAVCGSVVVALARGSDIDFYVCEFDASRCTGASTALGG